MATGADNVLVGGMADSSGGAVRRIEARSATSFGEAYVAHNEWCAPISRAAVSDHHWLELALLPSPRAALGCFPDLWGPQRYERFGELFLLPAHREIRARSECRVQSSIVCRFDPEATDAWLGAGIAWTDGCLRAVLNLECRAIKELVIRLGREVRQPGFASSLLIELLMGQIAIELGRHVRASEPAAATGGLAAWQLRRIDERLEAGPPPSLATLATLCRLSVRQLTRGFRASRGRSLGAYTAARTIDRARSALAAGNAMKVVAHDAGFAGPSSFVAAFRRATGETPSAYQRRVIAASRGPDRDTMAIIG